MNRREFIDLGLKGLAGILLASCAPNIKLDEIPYRQKLPGEIKSNIIPGSNRLVYVIPDRHAYTILGRHDENVPYQRSIVALMNYLGEKQEVKMIGLEGEYREVDGHYLRKDLIDEDLSFEEAADTLISYDSGSALEFLNPDHFYSVGLENPFLHFRGFEIALEIEDLKKILLDSKNTNEKTSILNKLGKLEKKRVKNLDRRDAHSIKKLIAEMKFHDFDKAMILFGAKHLPKLQKELEKYKTSWISLNPPKFVDEYYFENSLQE
ncbi:hypothetical protein ACFLZJ_02165 [Nanoarchaeota archaeon]